MSHSSSIQSEERVESVSHSMNSSVCLLPIHPGVGVSTYALVDACQIIGGEGGMQARHSCAHAHSTLAQFKSTHILLQS